MQTFINDAAAIWNVAPSVLKECTSLSSVKKTDKNFRSYIANLKMLPKNFSSFFSLIKV